MSYKAQEKLEAFRNGRTTRTAAEEHEKQRDVDRSLKAAFDAPPPGMGGGPVGIPMPPSFAQELDELASATPASTHTATPRS